jgi:hypothetical protein
MIQFAEVFPDEAIVVSLIRQLSSEYGEGFFVENSLSYDSLCQFNCLRIA